MTKTSEEVIDLQRFSITDELILQKLQLRSWWTVQTNLKSTECSLDAQLISNWLRTADCGLDLVPLLLRQNKLGSKTPQDKNKSNSLHCFETCFLSSCGTELTSLRFLHSLKRNSQLNLTVLGNFNNLSVSTAGTFSVNWTSEMQESSS